MVLLTFLAAGVAPAQSTAITVVNAASYGTTLAPDALASIFGNNLAQATAAATLDADGQLPTVLASTSVEIGGKVASLFYVSPKQINLVIPSGLDAGTATVVIRTTGSTATRSGTVLIAASAPAVFSTDASGAGPGAIINAVTYKLAPFLVQTPENGDDPRTRLAVYGTGFRHATTVTAQAQVSSGTRYPLTVLKVEYSGEAPGFFGLDQVNLLIPPELDGAGAVSLSLFADTVTANVVTFQMNLLPVTSLRLATLAFSPTFVSAGDSSTLTLGPNGVARTGGFAVGLRSSNSAAQVAPQITIPEGLSSTTTSVSTSATVVTTQTATITALAGTVTQTATLEIDTANSAQLAAVSTSVASVAGGKSLTGTVTLTGKASGSLSVGLASDNDKVILPASVTVPFGQSSANFNITTQAVTASQTVTLTATLGKTSLTSTLKVLPPLELTLTDTTVQGGASVTGTVTLGDAAPATGGIVSFRTSDPSVQVPTVTVPAGEHSQTFTLTTSSVASARTVTITATYAGLTQTASLTVNPPAAAALSSLTVSPTTVTGGSSAQGTVTLTSAAGAGGLRVTLQSSNVTTAAISPNFMIVPQGKDSATFTITTSRFPRVVTITATAGDVSKTASLTVK